MGLHRFTVYSFFYEWPFFLLNYFKAETPFPLNFGKIMPVFIVPTPKYLKQLEYYNNNNNKE